MSHKPMAGTWRLTAPDGRVYEAESPLQCCGAEQRDRIPAEVRLERLFTAADNDDVVLSKHIAERAALALEQGIDLPRVAQWVAADIRRAMTPSAERPATSRTAKEHPDMTDTPITHPLSAGLRHEAEGHQTVYGEDRRRKGLFAAAADELDRRAAEIARLRAEVEALRAPAVMAAPEGFRLVPEELSLGLADKLGELCWGRQGICPDGARPCPQRFQAIQHKWEEFLALVDPVAIAAARTPEGRSHG